ncbi:MAG TPA: type II toxin-antitoxin system RelE/ParE family toxin [Hanamia sp.]
MVQKIEWTEQSKNDLSKIKEYIAGDSLFQSERIIKLIYFSVQKLTSYPEIGKVIYRSEKYLVRRILIKNYRVIYVFHSDTIFILSVQHQSKELGTDFDLTFI